MNEAAFRAILAIVADYLESTEEPDDMCLAMRIRAGGDADPDTLRRVGHLLADAFGGEADALEMPAALVGESAPLHYY